MRQREENPYQMKLSKTAKNVILAAKSVLLILVGLAGVIFTGNTRQAIACLSLSAIFALLTVEGRCGREVYASGIKITHADHPKTYRYFLVFLIIASIAFFAIFVLFLLKS
ncbi:hypothetical protein KP005_04675 [Geomonas nitrogeniifigens]|uniref:DUF202 domain-containing protein n=1 Tax=Geomonas diazotrophica TaxID=2843197 RepID=A0ABX8JMI7_9BACT|nr:hypothetical protein [Geomonas nitrogeniifigens]QWV98587.1 hypothetical protein KP005_04675 [Geomonas nitrogeniifigens]